MIEEITFVVCRTFWEAPDESRVEYLTCDSLWSRNANAAWEYQSAIVFAAAEEYGGGVCMRLPSGKEVQVREEDFRTKS